MSLPPLAPDQMVKPRHFELRISLLFAALFVPLGIHLPYLPLWLEAKGFDAEQIAILLAAPMFVRVFTTPLITALADRAGDRAQVMIGVVAITFAISLGFFLPPDYATVMVVSLALSAFWFAHSPIADSLALSGVRRYGSKYTSMRIWGSMSFLIANFVGGAILSQTSAEAVPWMISIGLLATLAVSCFTPRLGRPRKASPLSAAEIQHAAPDLLGRYFLLFVTGAGVIIASHGFLYGFISIYWKAIGIGETVVGLLWAWAVVAEVGLFIVFHRWFGSVSATMLIAVAGVAAIVRWIATPLIDPLGLGVPGFFAVQSLHALSTALVLIGVQKLIGDTVPEDRTGAAQGIAFFANNVWMAVVTLASGPIYEWLGVDGFYVMVGVALAGLVLLALAARSAPERRFGG